MGIKDRIEKLERTTRTNKAETVTLVVVYDDTRKPSEAALEKAKAEYRAKHPDWQEQDYSIIYVTDERARELTFRVLAGEGT